MEINSLFLLIIESKTRRFNITYELEVGNTYYLPIVSGGKLHFLLYYMITIVFSLLLKDVHRFVALS